jgi:hypothetical protein
MRFHHYFQFSLYEGIRTVFEIKDADIQLKPSAEPSTPVLDGR